MAVNEYPPGSLGAERERIDAELGRIADDVRSRGGPRARFGAWLVERERLKARRRLDPTRINPKRINPKRAARRSRRRRRQ